jgi:hypothetical protein
MRRWQNTRLLAQRGWKLFSTRGSTTEPHEIPDFTEQSAIHEGLATYMEEMEEEKPPLIELRTTSIIPSQYAQFLNTTAIYAQDYLDELDLLGFFKTELGGVNEVVSMTQFDSFEQREQLYHLLRKAKSPVTEYFEKIAPMIKRQHTLLLRPSDQLVLPEQVTEDGFFELIVLHNSDCSTSRSIRKSVGGLLMGKFTAYTGDEYSNLQYQLWRYDSLDAIQEYFTEAVPLLARHPEKQSSKILIPTELSVLR